MKVSSSDSSPILLLHSVTVVLDNIANSIQTITPPMIASSVSLINNSRYETVKVTIEPNAYALGNLVVRLFPGEEVVVGFGTRLIKSVSIEAVNNPTTTMDDSSLVKKVAPLQGSPNTLHYVSVKFLNEKLTSDSKNCY